jgi:hypothetical protein
MSVLSWIRHIACAWRPCRPSRLGGWLLLAVAAVAVWPVAAVTGAGCIAARLRGWPAARLGRQAGWALPMAVVWIAAESARGWRAITLDPVRDGGSGWPHLTVTSVFRTFLLVAPVTIPAGLALAALLLTWRIYAATTGTGGWLASALVTVDIAAQVPAAREPLTQVPAARESLTQVPAARESLTQVPAARAPLTQAPVTLPAPRRETVPAALRLDAVARPGVRR